VFKVVPEYAKSFTAPAAKTNQINVPKNLKEYARQDQPTDCIASVFRIFQDFPDRQEYGLVAPPGNGNRG